MLYITSELFKVDWNDVAENLDITNGHAARMRFSRFKQQMEGVQPPQRKPRPGPAHHKRQKQEKLKPKPKVKTEKRLKRENQLPVKPEPDEPIGDVFNESLENPYESIKSEPATEGYENNDRDIAWRSLELHQSPESNFHVPNLDNGSLNSFPGLLKVKEEPQVKSEPQWDP